MTNRYRKGLRGELKVLSILKRLPETYIVYTNVMLLDKRRNIDAVVLGPSGLFAIEVKNYSGYISKIGDQLQKYPKRFEHNFIHDIKTQAWELHEFLMSSQSGIPYVHPIIVFPNALAFVQFGKFKVDGVIVSNASKLLGVIQNTENNHVLQTYQIEKINNILRKTTQNITQ